MSAQLIHRDVGSSELTKKLSLKILDSLERTDRMVRDLLDSNRIRAGEQLPLHKEKCDVTALFEITLQELTHTFGERFTFRSTGPVQGNFDPEGLRGILENLVTNAVKYGARNAPITITLDQNDKSVIFSVHNSGNPISNEDQKILFKRHRRSESSQSSCELGWGIGLTLVQGIVEAHCGHVQVESSPDRGTTFTVTLPKLFVASC